MRLRVNCFFSKFLPTSVLYFSQIHASLRVKEGQEDFRTHTSEEHNTIYYLSQNIRTFFNVRLNKRVSETEEIVRNLTGSVASFRLEINKLKRLHTGDSFVRNNLFKMSEFKRQKATYIYIIYMCLGHRHKRNLHSFWMHRR